MINSKKKGFTIVELVIVIAVVAILAAVLIPTFSNLVKKANESSDIQAVRNMNVYLAQANATGDVKSILDVYDIFEESEYEVENYQPLYKGRFFYYDKQRKQMVYVDENEKILFPADLAGQTQGTNDWFSLSTEIKLEEVSNTTESGSTVTYTVNTAGEYAWVVEQLNKGMADNAVINIDKDLDFKGAQVTINEVPTGKSLTINGQGHTLKNITSVEFTSVSDDNDDEERRYYEVSGLIALAEGDVTVTNITLENINVKNTHASNVGILIASNVSTDSLTPKNLTITNVTIKNSTVIGNRNVGALVGNQDLTTKAAGSVFEVSGVVLENVNVKTVVGNSGLLYGNVPTSYNGVAFSTIKDRVDASISKITINNCNYSVYVCEQNTGKCEKCGEDCSSTGTLHGYYEKADKSYSCKKEYSFVENALYGGWTGQ